MKLLRIRDVIALTGLSRMTIYRMERQQNFPSRRRLGVNSVAWIENEINTWIETRPIIEPHARFPTQVEASPPRPDARHQVSATPLHSSHARATCPALRS